MIKRAGFIFLLLSLVSLPLAGCSAGANEPGGQGEVTVTIGALTDKTGPGSIALSLIDTALADMVRYYNEENLIPGVHLEIISYDGQFDPANDIPGYEWLRQRGADVLFTSVPSAAITLKPRVERDEMILFSLVPNREAVYPPGHVFGLSTLCEYHSYNLLAWIAENDPDFPRDRPARIGGAGWPHDYMLSTLAGAEEYARAHPDLYDWQGTYATSFQFNWQTEVEAFRDCDYVIPPTLMNNFVRPYRDAGYKAKFIGAAIHTGFFSKISQDDIWAEIDGMRVIMPNPWWNEDSEMIGLVKGVLERYHPGEAEEIMYTSNGYLSAYSVYCMLEMIRETVERTGPEGFSPAALYETANHFSMTIDGRVMDTLTPEKRLSRDWFVILEFDAEREELVRVNPDEWLPVMTEP